MQLVNKVETKVEFMSAFSSGALKQKHVKVGLGISFSLLRDRGVNPDRLELVRRLCQHRLTCCSHLEEPDALVKPTQV